MKSYPFDDFLISPELIEIMVGTKKLYINLPKRTMADLQLYGGQVSQAKKIRDACQLCIQLQNEIENGGVILIRRSDQLFYKVGVSGELSLEIFDDE
jgi:hypothetical protein